MLRRLYAKNYALLEEITVEFEQGLNIITGETGAGKSILVGALAAILGEKVDSTAIRRSNQKVILEGEFQVGADKKLDSLLSASDLPPADGTIILRREVSPAGHTRSFVNDQPTPVAILEKVGEILVELHGQHEHQSLLYIDTHCRYLDEFGQLGPLVTKVSESLSKVQAFKKQLNDLRNQEKSLREIIELNTFQLREIQLADPHLGEDDQLEKEERILRNAERIYENVTSLYSALYEKEGAILDQIAHAETVLVELGSIDERFQPLNEDCKSARITLGEVASSLQRYLSDVSFDPVRLEEIRSRIAELVMLKKKYGGSLEMVLEHKHRCEEAISKVQYFDSEISNITSQIEAERRVLAKLCLELSEKRRTSSEVLERKITEQLAVLGMEKARIRVSLSTRQAEDDNWILHQGDRLQVTSTGVDVVEFLISANPGENLKPLAKIASGGEISRVMLALKSVLAQVDEIPCLIFDEIDSGISGRIAQAVGRSLRKLAQHPQVICITHLPQIASMADHHYCVEKKMAKDATTTSIRKLEQSERAEQVAKLLGGEKVTEAHLKSATELIAEAEKDGCE